MKKALFWIILIVLIVLILVIFLSAPKTEVEIPEEVTPTEEVADTAQADTAEVKPLEPAKTE